MLVTVDGHPGNRIPVHILIPPVFPVFFDSAVNGNRGCGRRRAPGGMLLASPRAPAASTSAQHLLGGIWWSGRAPVPQGRQRAAPAAPRMLLTANSGGSSALAAGRRSLELRLVLVVWLPVSALSERGACQCGSGLGNRLLFTRLAEQALGDPIGSLPFRFEVTCQLRVDTRALSPDSLLPNAALNSSASNRTRR